jgi:hypothetical protein
MPFWLKDTWTIDLNQDINQVADHCKESRVIKTNQNNITNQTSQQFTKEKGKKRKLKEKFPQLRLDPRP